MKNHLPNILKGAAMGIAEVIPGVSGGTIAFITGIYEQLLDSIKAFKPSLLGTLKNEGFAKAWREINGKFLLTLLSGMALGVIVGVFGVTHLLENYPVLLWSFFFGLIIASAIYIGRQLTSWSFIEMGLLILGAVIAFGITMLAPTQGSTNLVFVFVAGAIAISALILPGISGSFILLLMGMYTIVIPTVKKALTTFDPSSLLFLIVFALGCLTGLLTFANLLSWTFKNYKNQTLALLTGFMIGSLNKIWPWRLPVKGLNEKDQIITSSEQLIALGKEVKIIQEVNQLPWNFSAGEPFIFPALILMVIGFVSVFIIERFAVKNNTH